MQNQILKTNSKASISRLVNKLRRKKDNKIVFTNGVFDILHYGHINYLTKARELGDILILGLNTDSSVKKFKSKDRPLQNEMDRARILTALQAVDYVILFPEETPAKLIEMVKPDILVKGADYKISEIVGAKFVKSYGGEVKRIKFVKGRSSSKIINKLNS
ncbi:MAG: D-glycero-beta-D-manno-heptose 1-phosphate adenylyltransferase [candidate division Zixibacteria bacterium]|nr:D-glycero-beta-D-manno-heptose 1-phosphate adenylyltransferase [candidate division Zixibacteria bacterium]